MCVDTVFIKMHDFDNYLRKKVIFSSFFVCLSVCLSVCLLATLRKDFRTELHEIFREGWQWTSEQNNDKILVAIRITVWIQGLFFRICHYLETRKVVNGHKLNMLLILIRQMAPLVRLSLIHI